MQINFDIFYMKYNMERSAYKMFNTWDTDLWRVLAS